MRVWSFQPVEIYEQLRSKRTLYADENRIEMFHFDGMEDSVSRRAYDYMVENMVEKSTTKTGTGQISLVGMVQV